MVEIHGPILRVQAKQGSCQQAGHRFSGSSQRTTSKESLAHTPRRTSLYDHHGPGIESQQLGLPSTGDIAVSFLQHEPEQERDELQAALVQSQNVSVSQAIGEDGADATTTGVGDGLSLPRFVSDFLKGVGDRIQIRISNTIINLDMDLRLPSNNISGDLVSEEEDTVTMQITIADVDIEGITDAINKSDDASVQNDDTPKTRYIGFRSISGALVSKTSAFAKLRYPLNSPPPVMRQESPKASSGDPGVPVTSAESLRSESGNSMARSKDSRSSSMSAEDSEVSSGSSEDELRSCSEQDSPILFNPTCSPRLEHGEIAGSVFEKMNKAGEVTDQRADDVSESSAAFPGSFPLCTDLPEASSESSRDWGKYTSHSGSKGMPSVGPIADRKQSQHALSGGEDLSESRVFSHEEAESMYMSAISHASPNKAGSQIFGNFDRSLPGTWESSSSDEEIVGAQGVEPLTVSPEALVSQEERVSKDLDQSSRSQSGNNTPKATSTPSPIQSRLLSSRALASDHQIPAHTVLDLAEDTDEASSGSSVKLLSNSILIKKILLLDQVSVRLSHDICGISHMGVSLGHLEIVGDLEITKLVITMLQRFAEISNYQDGAADKPAQDLRQSPPSDYYLHSLNWSYLDAVQGLAPSESRISPGQSIALTAGSQTLLKASLKDVHLQQTFRKNVLKTEVKFGKINFGHTLGSILSFDSELKMRESLRDNLAPANGDLVVSISQSPEMRKIDVTSLPLHIYLDLRRLDETFNWFGGFSSFLGLGNSIMSTVTVTDPKPVNAPAKSTSKGVRFADHESRHTSSREEARNSSKITVRLGGIIFDMEGSDSLFRLKSTALKIVSRAEVIAIQVDRLNFDGPHSEHYNQPASLNCSLTNIRVEYLTVPKEDDLARLLNLLTPSKDRYGNDDDILLDTLLRQRRQGDVLRWTIDGSNVSITNVEDFTRFERVVKELGKLSSVTKYLPEDDRPGVLILGLLRSLQFEVYVDDRTGDVDLVIKGLEMANVTFPSLLALSIYQIRCDRNTKENLLEAALHSEVQAHPPVVMMRFIGNDLEPTIKIKVQDLCLEYRVTTLMALMGLPEDITAETLAADVASSVATIIDRKESKGTSPALLSQGSWKSESSAGSSTKALAIDITIRDFVVGLNPMKAPGKGLLVFTDSHLYGMLPKHGQSRIVLEVKKAALMAIDDTHHIDLSPSPLSSLGITQLQRFGQIGFVSLSTISAAKLEVHLLKSEDAPGRTIDVEIRDDLLVLESCADSTETLKSILNGLVPPMPPSQVPRYRTEVVNVQDMLASLTGDAFAKDESNENEEDLEFSTELGESDMVEDEVPQNLEYVSSFYNPDPEALKNSLADSMLNEDLEDITRAPEQKHIGDRPLLESFQEQCKVAPGDEKLHFQDDYFSPQSNVQGTAHRWNTRQDTYDLARNSMVNQSPLRIRLRDVHIIWNLFDGYDWQRTRDTLGNAVAAVEAKANEKRARKRRSLQLEDDEESVIGDFLFNSVYIGVNTNQDPRELSRQINRDIDDLVSETDTYDTSSTARSPTRQVRSPRPRHQMLKLTRSKYHKITFELKGLSADFVVFPQEDEGVQSSLDIRVHDLDIFDHVPTSTWKKFATYMHDVGERESGTNMIHLEILTVKPVPDLAASEIIMKATVLPLRLHVDQDALDFMTRFFEFRDDSAVPSGPKDTTFIQRVEVNAIRVKLDFKPKRIDYVGLRSGRTTEFMNFFILDNAEMVLRRIILYGVSGFDRLGKSLNDIWMPDIKQNQLPGVLAGLAPVRSLVNVGGGFKDLVVVPIHEYRKDGRIVRSIQKGALAFAKTTTTELVKLGAKLAIGTQTVLQGAEDFLGQPQYQDVSAGWEHASVDEDEKKKISLYADQPVGVVQGLRVAYTSLERDLLTAKDAIVAMPGEVMESGTARGAAKAVIRGAPTVILRPALGVSKAVGQTLMGTVNTMDPQHRRRIDEV